MLKLAGDALVALFRASDDEPLRNAALHAAQCGLAVQEALADFQPAEGVRLSSKVGIGLGEVVAIHVGGVFDRWELLVAGDPLAQMGRAEHRARPGERGPLARGLAAGPPPLPGDPAGRGLRPARRRRAGPAALAADPGPTAGPEAAPALLGYVPAAIRSRLDAGQGGWLAELRRITVLFVNLPGLNQAGRPRTSTASRW